MVDRSSAQRARSFPRAVLFDLDGTLLDSAPDMLAVVNLMRAERGRDPMPVADLRPVVSKGVRAMLAAAFPEIDRAERERWVPEFLTHYESSMGRYSRQFDGIEPMLAARNTVMCSSLSWRRCKRR